MSSSSCAYAEIRDTGQLIILIKGPRPLEGGDIQSNARQLPNPAEVWHLENH